MTARLYSQFDQLYNGKAVPTANEHQGQHCMQNNNCVWKICLLKTAGAHFSTFNALIQDFYVSFLDKNASDSP